MTVTSSVIPEAEYTSWSLSLITDLLFISELAQEILLSTYFSSLVLNFNLNS